VKNRGQWQRALAAAWFAVVLAAGGRGADEAPPASRPPVENSIEAAKRDFEAVKSSREAGLPQRVDGPRISIPEMRSGPSAPEGWTAARPKASEKKSSNWLVEAMEKSDPRKDRDREKDRSGKPERELDGLGQSLPGAPERESKSETERSETDAAEARKPTGTAVANPFTRYLGSWMSREDYAILKPGLVASPNLAGAGSGRMPSPVNTGPTGLSTTSSQDAFLNLTGDLPKVDLAPATPRENPYLALLSPPPSMPLVQPMPAPSTVPATAGRAPVMGPPPPPPPQSKIPDFAKPDPDEKYFKQLKRF
jgi:hypothetical protein